MKCKNHSQCKGQADGRDGLCSCCREVERNERRENLVDRRLSQLERKPYKPNYSRELDLEEA